MAAMTFKEIASNWSDAPSESYRREIWSSLRTGDWLAACRSAVEGTDTAVLEDWFDGHPILDWWRKGDDASAQVATAYLGCSLAICRAKRLMAAAPEDCLGASQRLVHAVEQTIGRKANGLNPRELLNLEWLSGEMSVAGLLDFTLLSVARRNAGASDSPAAGLLRDVARTILQQPLRGGRKKLALTALLVGEAGERGIVGNLTLELLNDGNGDFYPSPELCLRLDDDFLASATAAQAYVSREGLCLEAHDVRWTLERRDGRALGPHVSGGSAGALLALGLGKILIAD